MLMREYRGKALFEAAGLKVPPARLVRSAGEFEAPEQGLPFAYPVAVKAQVRSGGRGKAGGVVRCENAHAAERAVRALFATDFSGERPEAILIEPWLAIERELYLAVTIDASADGFTVLYAPRGGVDIESGPPPLRYPIGAAHRFRTHALRALLSSVESEVDVRERVLGIAERLVRIAAMHDCKTVEINPLAKLADGTLLAMDAKVLRDEWAAYRHADIAEGIAEEKLAETAEVQRCIDVGHMYVRLDGDIGLISGGAGMTMAAMDMIAQYGGRAACFLDCSPGPISAKGYAPAFDMLDADPQVSAILVSVIGGGTQMQYVAGAMRSILSGRKIRKPVVFRLDGTNVAEAERILAEMGVPNSPTLEHAVEAVVRLAKESR